MNKALFLDRDGVINRERGTYTHALENFEILPEVADALKLARSNGFLLIVISNQGGIAKGIYSKEQVELLHDHLQAELEDSGVHLDEIYYCPHHNAVGKCLCRKPGSLMLEKAIARFNINPLKSVLIGDNQRDIDAAVNAGVRGILVESNSGILNEIRALV